MIPNATLVEILNGGIDYENDDIRVGLLNDLVEYNADPVNHEFVSDITDGSEGDEYSDENYERQTLSNLENSQDDDQNRAIWDADDVTFEDLGSSDGDTIQAIFIFKSVTDDTDSPLLRVIEEEDSESLPLATNGTTISLQWDEEEGIKTLS